VSAQRLHTVQTMSAQRATSEGGGLLGSLLGGLLSGPAMGNELGEAAEGPAVFELADDVGEVAVGLDAEEEAAIGEGEGGGEALAPTRGACEEEVASGYGKHADSALAAAVVDLEASIAEAAAEEITLVDGVGGGSAQGGLGQELGVEQISPAVERVEERERAPPSLIGAGIGVKAAFLAVGLDGVEVGEVLDRSLMRVRAPGHRDQRFHGIVITQNGAS
jgi:hypothetical protein